MSAKGKHQKSPTTVDRSHGHLADVTEVWLICAPGEKTPKATWDAVNKATLKPSKSLSTNFKFHIPDLKVGTLDVLVGLQDDFAKLDPFVESVVHKVVSAIHETLDEGWDKVKEHFSVYGASVPQYLSKFQWDFAKYATKQSLKSIGDMIAKQATNIETEMKSKLSAYEAVKTAVNNYERNQGGTLLTRNLADVVSKYDFISDSKHLVTLLVVVPRLLYTDFINKYERLDEMVIPRSAKLIQEDATCGLFTVILFRKKVEQFKVRCRENKFVVRDFVYNERELTEETHEYSRLVEEKKMQIDPLLRWLKLQFGEVFAAWIHVKALRVYVESVLRYGLPVNFQPILMVPYKKFERKLRSVLHRLFRHLDDSSNPSGIDLSTVPGVSASSEYYPYVFYKINLDLLPISHH